MATAELSGIEYAYVAWPIRLALVCYVATLAIRLTTVGSGPGRLDRARLLWALGVALYALHVASAFHFLHGWSHEAALEHTARRTLDFVGVRDGRGLYLNYLVLLVWLADAAEWFAAGHEGYRSRPLWRSASIHGFLAFMVVNGAIVFAAGPTRWIGALAMIYLVALSVAYRKSRPATSD